MILDDRHKIVQPVPGRPGTRLHASCLHTRRYTTGRCRAWWHLLWTQPNGAASGPAGRVRTHDDGDEGLRWAGDGAHSPIAGRVRRGMGSAPRATVWLLLLPVCSNGGTWPPVRRCTGGLGGWWFGRPGAARSAAVGLGVSLRARCASRPTGSRVVSARPEGFEPATVGSEIPIPYAA